ncbi:hypothetical protein VN97_g10619 [Penicillium thymicola]|uniref:Uncharacterized protein n=1 Tax=Penicillium thymicola TaxID=293382 RepID=A0AAI9T9E2_PENTH|nr:hypothetical protein VN97_g10619 [Penicillium thymicola]
MSSYLGHFWWLWSFIVGKNRVKEWASVTQFSYQPMYNVGVYTKNEVQNENKEINEIRGINEVATPNLPTFTPLSMI